MMIGMVSYRISFLYHLFYQIRTRLSEIPHHKKGCRCIVLFQCRHDIFRVAVFIAAVKRQVQYLLFCISDIMCIVFFEFLRCRISAWLRAFRPESKPPVFHLFLFRGKIIQTLMCQGRCSVSRQKENQCRCDHGCCFLFSDFFYFHTNHETYS